MKKYEKFGTSHISSFFSISELSPLKSLISRIIYKELEKENLLSIISGISYEELPHKGLCKIAQSTPETMRIIVDKLICSSLYYNFISQEKVLEIVKKYTYADTIEDICFSDFHIRVDLPSSFTKEEKRFSLPWHQESNYFHKKVAKNSSIVIWIPIYDTLQNDGCLEVALGSHKEGVIQHETKYLLPEEKKHLRTFLDESQFSQYKKIYAEAKEGDIYINHFNLIHRSGKNINNKVRYTLLVRASNMNAKDFKI